MKKVDPAVRTKQRVRDALLSFVYGPLEKQRQGILQRIIRQNQRLLASSHASFTYKGRNYVFAEDEKLPRMMNPLHDSLRPQMEEYLADRAEVNNWELPYVMGFITQTLNASEVPEDWLRILPDCVHTAIHQLDLTLTDPELSDEEVERLVQMNAKAISMIRERLVQNLII